LSLILSLDSVQFGVRFPQSNALTIEHFTIISGVAFSGRAIAISLEEGLALAVKERTVK
jgi:hypothetical protein